VNESRPFEDQLPWLQPVEDEDEPRGVSARKMLAALLVVLMGAAIVAAAFFWLGSREAPVSGPPELIQAPPGPYKVKPPNPGGLDISAESETAFETSAGEDRDAQLDTSKLPNGTAAKPAEDPKADDSAKPAEPPKPEPAPAPKATGGTGSVIQLGAFANKAQAERAWTALSSRFPSVAGLNKMIVPFEHGMRLRAGASSAADAKQVCDTLKAAGENCFVAQ
jgi:cell division septation protein DedD